MPAGGTFVGRLGQALPVAVSFPSNLTDAIKSSNCCACSANSSNSSARALQRVRTHGDWEGWMAHYLEGVDWTARQTIATTIAMTTCFEPIAITSV